MISSRTKFLKKYGFIAITAIDLAFGSTIARAQALEPRAVKAGLKIDLEQAPAHVAFVLIQAAEIAERNRDYPPFKLFVDQQAALNKENAEKVAKVPSPVRSVFALASSGTGLAAGGASIVSVGEVGYRWDEEAGQKVMQIKLGQLCPCYECA